MTFTHGWNQLHEIYGLNDGGWMKLCFIGNGDFDIEIQDKFLNEIKYPQPANSYSLSDEIVEAFKKKEDDEDIVFFYFERILTESDILTDYFVLPELYTSSVLIKEMEYVFLEDDYGNTWKCVVTWLDNKPNEAVLSRGYNVFCNEKGIKPGSRIRVVESLAGFTSNNRQCKPCHYSEISTEGLIPSSQLTKENFSPSLASKRIFFQSGKENILNQGSTSQVAKVNNHYVIQDSQNNLPMSNTFRSPLSTITNSTNLNCRGSEQNTFNNHDQSSRNRNTNSSSSRSNHSINSGKHVIQNSRIIQSISQNLSEAFDKEAPTPQNEDSVRQNLIDPFQDYEVINSFDDSNLQNDIDEPDIL
ncbi:DNA-binding barrel domain superfamily [Sesbania bispinosa]|nr:DNA-binding barrel domain superfamily [Sesbania bispinosa]